MCERRIDDNKLGGTKMEDRIKIIKKEKTERVENGDIFLIDNIACMVAITHMSLEKQSTWTKSSLICLESGLWWQEGYDWSKLTVKEAIEAIELNAPNAIVEYIGKNYKMTLEVL